MTAGCLPTALAKWRKPAASPVSVTPKKILFAGGRKSLRGGLGRRGDKRAGADNARQKQRQPRRHVSCREDHELGATTQTTPRLRRDGSL